jgi:hypothetical protein
MEIRWNNGNFPVDQFGIYAIKYRKGARSFMGIFKYVDTVVSCESDLMFESFGQIETTIIEAKDIYSFIYLSNEKLSKVEV